MNAKYVATVLLINACLSAQEVMVVHAIDPDYFNHSPVPLDKTIYQLLLNNPIKKRVNYLAVASSWLVQHAKNNKKVLPHLSGGFVVCQHAGYQSYSKELSDTGLEVLFTPHASGDEKYGNMRVLPMPHLAMNPPGPALQKDIWYSFVGADMHPIRRKIFGLKAHPNAVIKRRDIWHFYPYMSEKKRAIEKKEYDDVLSRSRFSLCPRGVGGGTLRFWESLCAGAIPIVIPAKNVCLPGSFDWDSCIIALEEEDIPRINEILREISPERETAMREQCYKAYEQFSGKNLTSCIRTYYEEGPWEAWTPVKAAEARLAAVRRRKKYYRIRTCALAHRRSIKKGSARGTR